jgi:hypothetical protein
MLATLLLALLTGGVADEPLPVVTYDLSDLLPRVPSEQRGLRPAPFQQLGEEFGPDASDQGFGDVPDVVAEMLSTCLARNALQIDGADVSVIEGGRLHVTAPAEAQHDTAALLGLLRAGLQRQAVVTLELLRVADAGAVTPEGLDADLASGRVQRVLLRTETVRIGSSADCLAETRRKIVVDSDPEIAQHTTTSQPVLRELDTGLRAFLRVEDAGGGRYTLRCAARVSELRELSLHSEGLQSSLTTDAGVVHSPALGNLERPDVSFATLAASGRVQAGETLLAAAGSETAHGPVGWVLRLGLASAEPPPAPMTSADGQHGVAIFDVSQSVWPRLSAPQPSADALAPMPYDESRPWIQFPSEPAPDLDAVAERVQVACDRAGEEVWLARRGNWLLACSSPGGVAIATQEVEAQRLAAADVVVSLVATLRGEGGKARPVASLRLPLRPDDAALGWAGSETLITALYDVDVAESASTPDPAVAGLVDGLALRATTGADGRARVELVLNRVLGTERVPIAASGIESFERPVRGVVSLQRDLRPGQAAHLDGLGDPFSALASLSVELASQPRTP